MKSALILALVVLATASQWEDFKATFGRQYAAGDEAHAQECFQQNLKVIATLNAVGNEKHGVNLFSDMCAEEFKAKYLTYKYNGTRTRNYLDLVPQHVAQVAANSSVDWRTKGAVTAVKNQAQCGSCWAFSSTGNMEGQWMLAGHPLTSLSEQELVSCSGSAGNEGCNGGLMDNAFQWVIQKGGIVSEATYPYTSGTGITGVCKPAKESPIAASFTSFKDIAKDEDQMAAFVLASGPLAIAVDAQEYWQTYTGGILKTCNGRSLDHGVLIVGFGSDGTTPYWIVKNSWSASWGEQGYIRLAKGSDQCGLTSDASTIVV